MASLRSGGGTSAPIGSIGARAGEKPSGEHVDEMVGPGAWPDTHESVFTDRATQLNEKLSALRGALEGWGTHQASIFNGPHVWSGVGASAAGGKVESNAQAMRNHEQQLRDAISWCNEAAGHIGTAKQSITENVNAGIDEINQTLGAASQSDKDPTAAIDAIVQRKYGENVATLGNAAKLLDFKGEVPAAPPRKPGDSGYGAQHDEAGETVSCPPGSMSRRQPQAQAPDKERQGDAELGQMFHPGARDGHVQPEQTEAPGPDETAHAEIDDGRGDRQTLDKGGRESQRQQQDAT